MKHFSSFKLYELILTLKKNRFLYEAQSNKKEEFFNTDAMELTGNVKYSSKNKSILYLEVTVNDDYDVWWIPVKVSDLAKIKSNWFICGNKFPEPNLFSLWRNESRKEETFWNK